MRLFRAVFFSLLTGGLCFALTRAAGKEVAVLLLSTGGLVKATTLLELRWIFPLFISGAVAVFTFLYAAEEVK